MIHGTDLGPVAIKDCLPKYKLPFLNPQITGHLTNCCLCRDHGDNAFQSKDLNPYIFYF